MPTLVGRLGRERPVRRLGASRCRPARLPKRSERDCRAAAAERLVELAALARLAAPSQAMNTTRARKRAGHASPCSGRVGMGVAAVRAGRLKRKEEPPARLERVEPGAKRDARRRR